MGLLDEAIREHLELKRRSGADPTEIAHAERAALTPLDDSERRGEPVVALGEETAEIDMEAVLAAGDHSAAAAPPAADAGPGPGAEVEGEGFEWDDAAAREHDADAEGPPEQIPGQERMSLE